MLVDTVRDFLELSVESRLQEFEVWDCDNCETVYEGTIDECPEEYLNATFESFDVIAEYSPKLVINASNI